MDGFDEVFDFVVVGSGGGSMCAGLVMRSLGKSVLILEKTDLVGGTTARSGGEMWIPNNIFMKRDGIEDSLEKAITYLDSVVGDHNDTPGTTRDRRLTYLIEGPRMVEFLVEQGIKLMRVWNRPDYFDDQPGGSVFGRSVVAQVFNAAELGDWEVKLRPSALQFPASLPELFDLRDLDKSWRIKLLALKVALRSLLAKLTGKRLVTAGGALQGRMLQAAVKSGVEIRINAPVQELLAEGGVIKGVLALIDGRRRRIGARLGVLINAGGFALNQKMRDRFQPGTSSTWTSVTPGDTGEMIEEMMRHGAAVAQMEEMVGLPVTLPPGAENMPIKAIVHTMLSVPHTILVDQSGMRYLNESNSYMAYCQAMLERNRTVPAVPSWAVFDSQFMENYMLLGSKTAAKKPKRWFDEGFIRKASSVEELAKQIGIDPEKLKATVDRFNGFVTKNHDDDFRRGDREYDLWLGDRYHKPSAVLGTIAKAPFYAIPVVPGDVGTYGGVVTDQHARVLRVDGSVIDGLYATGVSTASVMGRAYPGGGASVGPSFVWGYIAANRAAERAK